ncbi:UDP-N-acetylglucosamine--N-acetylmuramyl-(pentapeptide) pyrophosphoryl-undecaprenol N-acetylglucosamine transferase [Catalinimonas alkaloidigena]|uniref:UDP-N-acetylglucosamine--N-acetylmuramyl-(pentapeptide) pyrophosphoryl-undecaprenol N-acetylglucosamine transferase n=1 Tax=Catalinimonas alkaloidigena TaxID=1075417 RepID=A0A1G9JAQ5_9BACT|nr:undecaprenyldiphospho-muramoylpentapeptide beta-N-acetylglucosaminyltransferase [Catalinimonas alkaloidigena]SDL34285.1 UDP-N-acetylglucosamine--N-acetylmuramyl-(pentapeptide) pyrophosphoryl-undecaprenol N-acetylglucosamine transferase [Catalinimonas alkaloidigena]
MAAEKPSLKVIISGGGTGGHIFPAIAIARALQAHDPRTEVLFVGARNRMEMQKVPQAGYPIVGLWISGIQRRLTLDNLLFPVKLVTSIAKARKVIKDFKPDVAVGVGGYASGPLLYAAARAGVPTLIQEQNSYAGLTNKWLSRYASKICVAYEGMEKFFPAEKIVLTGNPVRKDIADAQAKREQALKHFKLSPDRPVVLTIGGSLGARTINRSIAESLYKFEQAGYQLIWQTGESYAETGQRQAQPFERSGVRMLPFIKEMDLAYAAADVVISRAGALSISELCIVGKPAVLVPSPNVSEDHQTKNAMALVNRNAAVLVRDAEAEEKLFESLDALMKDEAQQKQLADNIKAMAHVQADQEIARYVRELAGK